jgi:hypothetical protein
MRNPMIAPRIMSAGFLGSLAFSAAVANADPLPPRTVGVVAPLEEGQHFSLDPVSDGVITAAGFGFSFLLGEVLSTGEIRPPVPSVSASSLLPIDRAAVTQKIDPNAGTYSNIGLYAAVGTSPRSPCAGPARSTTSTASSLRIPAATPRT